MTASPNKKGTLFVLSGPSGAGKGTLIQRVFEIDNSFYYSVSATTRQMRDGEEDGVNYFFLTREKFEELIDKNELLEYTEFCGNYYGTPTRMIDEKLGNGISVILEIETDGASRIKKKRPDCKSIFILPPSYETLAHRLRKRNTETEEKIQKRLARAKEELLEAEKYDFKVINDELKNEKFHRNGR